jgi:hypothetical protein
LYFANQHRFFLRVDVVARQIVDPAIPDQLQIEPETLQLCRFALASQIRSQSPLPKKAELADTESRMRDGSTGDDSGSPESSRDTSEPRTIFGQSRLVKPTPLDFKVADISLQ